jgi:hypothetical protein
VKGNCPGCGNPAALWVADADGPDGVAYCSACQSGRRAEQRFAQRQRERAGELRRLWEAKRRWSGKT